MRCQNDGKENHGGSDGAECQPATEMMGEGSGPAHGGG